MRRSTSMMSDGSGSVDMGRHVEGHGKTKRVRSPRYFNIPISKRQSNRIYISIYLHVVSLDQLCGKNG